MRLFVLVGCLKIYSFSFDWLVSQIVSKLKNTLNLATIIILVKAKKFYSIGPRMHVQHFWVPALKGFEITKWGQWVSLPRTSYFSPKYFSQSEVGWRTDGRTDGRSAAFNVQRLTISIDQNVIVSLCSNKIQSPADVFLPIQSFNRPNDSRYCEWCRYRHHFFQVEYGQIHSFALFFLNGPAPASFQFIFDLFKQTIQFLQQINVKKCQTVHPVYSPGIRTHDLVNMSRHP